jgi:hypothetical protein
MTEIKVPGSAGKARVASKPSNRGLPHKAPKTKLPPQLRRQKRIPRKAIRQGRIWGRKVPGEGAMGRAKEDFPIRSSQLAGSAKGKRYPAPRIRIKRYSKSIIANPGFRNQLRPTTPLLSQFYSANCSPHLCVCMIQHNYLEPSRRPENFIGQRYKYLAYRLHVLVVPSCLCLDVTACKSSRKVDLARLIINE